MMDDSKQYAPSESARILEQPPSEPYEVIARLETRGYVGQGIPHLLEQARTDAKRIGADAIIPIEERQEQLQGFIYNPWLGGYQTINRGPVITSYAIILQSSIPQRIAAYSPPPSINGGVSYNALAAIVGLNGYGISGWIGRNRLRVTVDYYAVDIPQAMTRDGFLDGQVENAARFSVDYFVRGRLTGPYWGLGLQQATYSVGHENTLERGNWESIDLCMSVGYKLDLLPHVNLGTRIAFDAVLYGEEEIFIGGYRMVPDDGKLFGAITLGISF